MQDLLTKGIDKNGKIRSEQTHEFKDSPLGRIPKEWECYLFKEIIQNFDSGWSPNCEAQPASINEWGSLKTTSITWDGYNSDENKRLPLNLNPNPKLEVQFDDILITRVGPRERVGVVVHVNDYREKLMISDNMLRLKIIPSSKIFLPFLPLMLGSTSIQKDFKNKIAGLAEAQVVINQQSIKSTFIFMPSKNEQEQIYFRHKKMNELIISENKKLSKLQSLKTGLMQDLLSGKVRVNNLKLKEANETALA
jgi:type I restriction enzyme S subunit